MSSRVIGACSVVAVAVALTACAGNPDTSSGLTVHDGVGITDFFTVRSTPDGDVTTRDVAPTPRPREAITTDDYFGIKLEHIYAGGLTGREVGNLAIITSIDGIIPDGVRCEELPEAEMEFGLSDQQTDNATSHSSHDCAFKSIVQLNPVFRDSHATFDSVFITPPFRTGTEELSLQFIMAQLNDVTLARQIVDWVQERTEQLTGSGVLDVTAWQSELINIGFTAVNYLLNRAAEPSYVFELTTDFIPVETVEGAQPQNLLMGGDFVVVGMTETSPIRGGLMATDQLVFNSGRLYWQGSGEEYTDTPYVVFKVVRYSRYPNALPDELSLSQVNRDVRRGLSPDEVEAETRDIILTLQDAHIMNETEGEMLLDMFEWYAEAAIVRDRLDEDEYEEEWQETGAAPMMLSALPPVTLAGFLNLEDVEEAAELMRQLEDRFYANYGQTPGLRQDECVTLTSITQDLADLYREAVPDLLSAYENMALRRYQLSQESRLSDGEEEELDALVQAEPGVLSTITSLPGCENYNPPQVSECDYDAFPEPICPEMRQAYIVEE